MMIDAQPKDQGPHGIAFLLGLIAVFRRTPGMRPGSPSWLPALAPPLPQLGYRSRAGSETPFQMMGEARRGELSADHEAHERTERVGGGGADDVEASD